MRRDAFASAQKAAYRKKRKEEKLKKLEEEAVLAQSMPSASLAHCFLGGLPDQPAVQGLQL